MTALVDFLLARVADDERTLRTERELYPHSSHGLDAVGTMRPDICPTCRRLTVGWSTRGLAECDAKRRIVMRESDRWQLRPEFGDVTLERRSLDSSCYIRVNGAPMTQAEFRAMHEPAPPSEVLRLLALPYVDHPDYRQEWAP